MRYCIGVLLQTMVFGCAGLAVQSAMFLDLMILVLASTFLALVSICLSTMFRHPDRQFQQLSVSLALLGLVLVSGNLCWHTWNLDLEADQSCAMLLNNDLCARHKQTLMNWRSSCLLILPLLLALGVTTLFVKFNQYVSLEDSTTREDSNMSIESNQNDEQQSPSLVESFA